MTLLRQQLVFLLVAFLSVLFFFLYQENISQFFALPYAQFKMRIFKYAFSILLNYALIAGLYLLLRKTWATIFLSQFVVFLLTFINIQKEHYLAASLVPSDFLLLQETLKAAPTLLMLGVLFGLGLSATALVWLYKKESREPKKLILGNALLSVSIIGFFVTANFKNNFYEVCASKPRPGICRYHTYLPNTRGDWVGDHLTIKSLGFSTFFFSKSVDNLNSKIFQNQNIPKEKIEQLLKREATTPVTASIAPESPAQPLPNIIFVMSESHWDARKLDPSIPKNITPTIDQNQISQVLSPSFGGGTANVEFEVLTSLNVQLNQNELLYVSKLKRPIYALPHYMNQLGYNTTAMHNNGKYFYNRSAVYQHLGFQRFISLENMTNAANRKQYINQAGWANDDLLYASIEQQLTQTDQPQFIYAISVENHPMYNDDRFGRDAYQLTKPGLSEASKRQLNTYLMGMKRADDKLKQLIQNVSQLERPTLIIFFGDHLPNLQQVYDDYGFFASAQDKAEKKQLKYFETPLAVWSNFPIDQKQLKQEYIPAHFLAHRVLSAAHLPLSAYYQFTQQINDCYRAIHPTAQHISTQCSDKAVQADRLSAYQDLNMDVMNGKNWTYQILKQD